MKRLLMILAVLVIPASVWAQVPPIPPTPPSRPVAPAPMAVPVPKAIPRVLPPGLFDSVLEGAFDSLQPLVGVMGEIGDMQALASQEAMARARVALDEQRVALDTMKADWSGSQEAREAMVLGMTGMSYDLGLSLLSRRDYDKAVAQFDKVITQKDARTDAAMYHKAYALYRLGRSSDATATLSALKRDYAKSPYLKDAAVLEAAVRESAGQPMRPEQADNDELKLLALNALQHSDPERALPLLEGVLTGANSLQLKQRAIFVLAQSTQPRARQMLMDIAKGGGNPDLQRHAIRYLATGRRGASSAELREIYESTQDVDIKKVVLQSWGQPGGVFAIADVTSGAALDRMVASGVTVRSTGVRQLADTQANANATAAQDLWALYQKEQNRDLKLSILSRLGALGANDRLNDVIKSERDPEIRRRAIRSLGSMPADKSAAALTELYGREDDVENKKAIISALANQNNGEALVAIARKETNMTLKRDIVSRLSTMTRNKAAMDYMLEIIK